MQPKRHVTLKNTKPLQASLRQTLEVGRRPPKKNRIDRLHLEERIFPFDQPIEGRTCALCDVKKNQRLRIVRCWHLRMLWFVLPMLRLVSVIRPVTPKPYVQHACPFRRGGHGPVLGNALPRRVCACSHRIPASALRPMRSLWPL